MVSYLPGRKRYFRTVRAYETAKQHAELASAAVPGGILACCEGHLVEPAIRPVPPYASQEA